LSYRETLLWKQYDIDLPFSPKIIVDAGANIGTASVYFAQTYPEARIIAVEAEPSNFEVLVRNVRHYPAITPVHAALWSRDGEISVSEPDPSSGSSGEWGFVTHDGPGRRVRAITMRTLMQEMQIPVIDLAKIDIEGAEQEVFQDTMWMKDMRCLMIELHDRFRPGCTAAVEPAMNGFVQSQRFETTFYVRGKQSADESPGVCDFL
jgi:FkbM family methyltransferase